MLTPSMLKMLAGALLVAAVGAGIAWFAHHEREIGRAEIRAQIAREAAAEAARNAKETQRRLDQQEEAQRAHDEDLARAAADAAAARDVAGRLRLRVDELVAAARRGAGNPASGGQRPATEDPIGVLAELQRRADARAGVLAEYADRARIAGQQCERAYDALTARPAP